MKEKISQVTPVPNWLILQKQKPGVYFSVTPFDAATHPVWKMCFCRCFPGVKIYTGGNKRNGQSTLSKR
jgi:hypothetical protein